MYHINDLVYVKYHDLKCDIYVVVYFENPHDFLEFFSSKYNPNSYDIIKCNINFHSDIDSDD